MKEFLTTIAKTKVSSKAKAAISGKLSWNEYKTKEGVVSFECPKCKENSNLKIQSFRLESADRPEELKLTDDTLFFTSGLKRFISFVLGFVCALFISPFIEGIFQIEGFNVIAIVIFVVIWTIFEKIFDRLFSKKIPIWFYECKGCGESVFIASDAQNVVIGGPKEKKEEARVKEPEPVKKPELEKAPVALEEREPVVSVEPQARVEEAPEIIADEDPVSQTETLRTSIKELAIGSTFAGRYQIIEELGKGGMGKVYKVLDKQVEEKVALKLIKPEIAAEEKTIQRFRNELKLARKISHKNVCRMFDFNKEADAYYITMEYVPGEDLKSSLRRMGPLSVGKAVIIAKQVCEGLAEAHELGVVHRDLKPQNIMIDREGNVCIMDFGIARSLKAKEITDSGIVIGTPEYMSPEQVEGKKADQRSDIYSMGTILYEMVTGRIPFEGDTPLSIAVKHKSEAPPDPKEINDQISEDLSCVILKCMEKDKEMRYQKAEDLLSDLRKIEKGLPTTEKVLPERKPLTSKEITVTFRLKKLIIPASVVVGVAIIVIVIWRLIPRAEVTQTSLPPPAPAEQRVSQEIKEPEAKLPSKAEQEIQVTTPLDREKEKVDIYAKLDLGIKSFDREAFDLCILQMEEILKLDPQNTTAKYFLAEAKKRKEKKLIEQEVSERIKIAQNAYQEGNYQECIDQTREVLKIDPENVEAKKYSNLASLKIAPLQINAVVKQYIQSLSNKNLVNFYENVCSSQLYQKIKRDAELIADLYDNFKSIASSITIRFKENDRVEVSFSNITTGVLKKDGRRQVIFEGVYVWDMEKQGDTWKIINIIARPSEKK